MSCRNAKYDPDTGRYDCKVTGDGCIFLCPNEKSCKAQGYLDDDYEGEDRS